MDADSDLDQRIAGIAALDQPVRRDLYRLLCRAEGWTSRDEASDALGIGRPTAAFHLDKLAEAGVVETGFERRTGRSGPGAGRPSKLYRPAGPDVSATVPDRHYDLAASLLATAVADATRTGEPVTGTLRSAARAAGTEIGAAQRGRPVAAVLDDHGYEPRTGDGGDLALANCPFHRLAREQTELICTMNLDYLTGLLAGLAPDEPLRPRLDPRPGWCCVRLAAG